MPDKIPQHHSIMVGSDISEGKVEGYPNDPYLRFRTMFAGTHSLYDISTIRVTGYFEGTKLVPVVMHYVTDGFIHESLKVTSSFRPDRAAIPGSFPMWTEQES